MALNLGSAKPLGQPQTLNLGSAKPLNLGSAQPITPAPAPAPTGYNDPDYFQDLMGLENRPLSVLPDSYSIKPNQAPEQGGGMDIGYGHKLTPAEQQSGTVYGIPWGQGITGAQAKEVLQQDINKHWADTRIKIGSAKFDALPKESQRLLVDYSFNGVLDQFPKFTAALVAGDLDTAEKEYVRYMKKGGKMVPLGARNTYTFAQLQKLRAAQEPSAALPVVESVGSNPPAATPDLSVAEGPGVWDKTKEFLRQANPLGAVEGLGSVATGLAAFPPAAAVAAGEVLKGTMAGDPIGGLAAGREEMDKVMEAMTYMPKTPGGQVIAEYAGMPFLLAHEGIGATVRSAGGDEEQVKAATAAFDVALAALPLAKGVKTPVLRRKPTPAEVKEFKETAKNVPGVDAKVLEDVLTELKAKEDAPLQSPPATNPANQSIVDGLVAEAQARPAGRRRDNYLKAAEKYAQATKDAAEFDPVGFVSKKAGKTSKRVEELLAERETQTAPVTEPAPVTGESPRPVEPLDLGEAKPLEPKVEPKMETAEAVPEVTSLADPKADFAAEARAEADLRIKQAWERKKRAEWSRGKREAEMVDADPNEFLEGLRDQLEPTREELQAEAQMLKEDIQNLKSTPATPETKAQRAGVMAELLKKHRKSYVDLINTENPTVYHGSMYGFKEFDPALQGSNTQVGSAKEAIFFTDNPKIADVYAQKPTKDFLDQPGLASPRLWKELEGVVDPQMKEVMKEIDRVWKETKDPKNPELLALEKKQAEMEKVAIDKVTAPNITPAKLDLKNPLVKDMKHFKDLFRDRVKYDVVMQKTIKKAKEKGHDGVIFKNAIETGNNNLRGTTYAVFNKDQIKPKWEVKEKELGLFDDEFKTFKTEEAALEFKEERGKEGEVIQDPVSGEWIIEPELRDLDDYRGEELWREDAEVLRDEELFGDEYGEQVELSDTGTRALWDIMGNERGSVPIDDLRILTDKLKGIQAEAKRAGVDLREYLAEEGYEVPTIEQIVKAIEEVPKNEDRLREADPVIEGILNPEGEIYFQGANKYNKGKVTVPRVPISKETFDVALGARKIKQSEKIRSGIADALETRINKFERFGKKTKDLFYDNWVRKLADSKREYRQGRRELKADLKGISRAEREQMSIAAHARQKGGPELLERMGITEIPELTPRQEALVQKYGDKLAKLRDRINYTRTKIGLRPLKKVENYFTWAHKVNEMKNAGIFGNEGMMTRTQAKGAGRVFKETLFPYSKKRGKRSTPIELDIFDGYLKYTEGAMREIHVNPVAALAKEVANMKIKVKGEKGSARMENINPELVKTLREWSDEILGIDPAYEGWKKNAAGIAHGMDQRVKNLTVATLFGTLSTAMKQPLAIIGVFGDTRLSDVGYGIGKAALDRGTGQAAKKSNVLEIRNMDVFFDGMAESVSKNGLAGVKEMATEAAKWPMTFLDAVTAEIGWNAGYRFATKKLKLGEKEAVQWADDLVTRTQGVGVRGAVSPIQASKLTKWATLFQTFAINDFNYIARDMLGIRNPDIKRPAQVKRVLKYVAASAVANELFEAVGWDAPKPQPIGKFKEIKDDGGSNAEAMGEAAMELIEVVPIIGGAVKYGSSAMGPVAQFATDVPAAIRTAFETLDWGNMSAKQRFNAGLELGTMLGKWYGIPMTNQLKKSIRAAGRGGNAYEVILGLYTKEAKKGSGGGLNLPGASSLTLPELSF